MKSVKCKYSFHDKNSLIRAKHAFKSLSKSKHFRILGPEFYFTLTLTLLQRNSKIVKVNNLEIRKYFFLAFPYRVRGGRIQDFFWNLNLLQWLKTYCFGVIYKALKINMTHFMIQNAVILNTVN